MNIATPRGESRSALLVLNRLSIPRNWPRSLRLLPTSLRRAPISRVQPAIKDLDQFKHLSEGQFKALGFIVLSTEDMKVGNHRAVQYVYTGTLLNRAMKFRAVAVERQSGILLVTCTALEKNFDEYDKAFRESLATLSFAR